MKTGLVRALGALLGCGLFATAMPAGAVSYEPDALGFVDVVVLNDAGNVVLRSHTGADGRVALKGLAPGSYEIAIDGNSLVAALDRLPSTTAEKKGDGSGVGIGIGGSLFGGGGHSGRSGGQGASRGGGGMGVGVAIRDSGSSDRRDDGTWSGNWHDNGYDLYIEIGWDRHDATGNTIFAVDTPICPDGASRGARIGFAVPEGGGPVTLAVKRYVYINGALKLN